MHHGNVCLYKLNCMQRQSLACRNNASYMHNSLQPSVCDIYVTRALQQVSAACGAAMGVVGWLILPHNSLVLVELFARGAHNAVLLAADVAAVWRLDGHLGVCTKLEDERLGRSLVCVDATVAVHRPVLAVVACIQPSNSTELNRD